MREDCYSQLGYGDPSINNFILVCDTVKSILECTRKNHFQALCIQVDMPEKLWSCWGTYDHLVHKTKILQVINAIALENNKM